jgi:hypothetical protein
MTLGRLTVTADFLVLADRDLVTKQLANSGHIDSTPIANSAALGRARPRGAHVPVKAG